MARPLVPATARQQLEPLVQPDAHLGQAEGAHAGGGEFQGQRDAFQGAAQGGEVGGVPVGHGEVRADGLRPVHEHLRAGAAGKLLGGLGRVGDRQGHDRHLALAGHVQTPPGRHQTGQGGRFFQEGQHGRGGARRDLLEVV